MKLAPNFSLAEFEFSDYAARNDLDNRVPPHLLPNITRVARWLQVLRDRLGSKFGPMPVVVTSGYRGDKLNRAIGGSKTSAHCAALAADFHVPGMSIDSLFAFIREEMADVPMDQVIHEFGRWIHLGLAQPNKVPRNQFLYAEKVAGKTVYRLA